MYTGLKKGNVFVHTHRNELGEEDTTEVVVMMWFFLVVVF